MKVKMNVNDGNSSITIGEMSNEEFDSVRIILKTLMDYSDIFNRVEDKNSLSLENVIKQVSFNS